ncbi:hypothetical protein FMM80_23000 [Schaedlerella arabinosiphila]|uniref:Uncharacterized protein n=1 Tax=Schaedlerella arabinosiphila TaxID=2044587 RepID=A0A9X5CB19_9FIRM|nr:hypothetical protein [Schaedlerella arabinosiphila]KAI4442331.1 hypothetical protein C824_004842 [Schaedlerella arabinosiphila]NDO71359.1 hypothetical protein [Schaedlerella arabinosiphila]
MEEQSKACPQKVTKIWTAQQLPLIKRLGITTIPESVVNEVVHSISIFDTYYGAGRNVDNDHGGFLLLYTDFPESRKSFQPVLSRYHVSLDDAEFQNIIHRTETVVWYSELYLISSDYAIIIIYPTRKER